MWNTGDLIDGMYEVRQVFTSGGMGNVYRVYHRSWDMDLALKQPRVEPLIAIERIRAFHRECELWSGINPHPHVVTCYYLRMIDNVPCVLTEFVDGGSLVDWIQCRRLYTGTEEIALARIFDIAIQSAWGLEQAHFADLVHQDVKPGNILVMADGTAKITDFGLASLASGSNGAGGVDSTSGELVSVNGMTPAFCSPEQARKDKISFKSDIYSWAVSVLEMFTGEVTWANGVAARYTLAEIKGKPIAADIPEMPKFVFDLLSSCLSSEPDQRPDGFREIADQLQVLFLDIFGEPHDRVRPDMALAELDALNNRALSMLDLGHPREEAEDLLLRVMKEDPMHPQASFNLDLLRSGRFGSGQAHFMLAKPKSGFDYYEDQRKFERLCTKMKRALETGQKDDALRYLQQANDLDCFRRHPRLIELMSCVEHL